jgi:hypothetical protein
MILSFFLFFQGYKYMFIIEFCLQIAFEIVKITKWCDFEVFFLLARPNYNATKISRRPHN